MSEDVSKIRAALEILRTPNRYGTDKKSWTRGALKNRYGGEEQYCILGALRHVGLTNRTLESPDIAAIHNVINEQFPREYTWNIYNFNDFPGRTFDEVEIVLEKAAVLREEEGAESDWSLS